MKDVRRKEAIVVWSVYLIFTIFLTVQGVALEWSPLVYVLMWVQFGILCLLTFIPFIPVQIQSYILTLFAMDVLFVTSVMRVNFSATIILLVGFSVLTSIYRDVFLELIQTVLSLLIVLVHYFILGTLQFTRLASSLELIGSIIVLIGTSIYLQYIIGRQNRFEKNLMENVDRAVNAERSKSDFLANMSHEIRTPMNAIMGMCELIQREDSLSEDTREYTTSIQNAGRSLLSIINDILDFSKIDSGKMDLIKDEFNIASILNDVLNMTIARLGDKKLEIVVNVESDIPKGLFGDEIRLRQIIVNLMTNAVKYTNQGVIVLEISHTKRDYGINLLVRVRDTGIGIKPYNLEKLFTSFQQVDTKKNRSVEGTGLGLAISKRLVNQMGGFIDVTSEYGKGSEFKFVVPLGVVDEEPFLSVKDNDKISALCYLDYLKYSPSVQNEYVPFIANIAKTLKIKNTLVHGFEDVQDYVSKNEITHLFLGKEEYLANREYFVELSNRVEIYVVQNRSDAVPVENKIQTIYKPFYAMPIAGVMNHERMVLSTAKANAGTVSFSAPKARILLVDDNVINLQVANGLMQPYHMQIMTAQSGDEAIRMLGSKDYDVVLMDHMMPVMDGVEATKIIRGMSDDYYKTLPIIALTANVAGNAKEMFLNNGFDGFIAKPIELSVLDRTLKQFLPKELIERPDKTYDDKTVEQDNDKSIRVPKDAMGIVDVDTGLIYTGNSVDAYLSILRVYVDKGKEKLVEIEKLFTNKDWKNYIIEAHALKSSSLSTGAKKLSEFAKKLELSGKAGEFHVIEENHQTLISYYQEVIFACERLLKENHVGEDEESDVITDYVEISKEELTEALNKLKDAADSFDGDEMLIVLDKLVACTYEERPLQGVVGKAKSKVDDFEYDAAYQLVMECDEIKGAQ